MSLMIENRELTLDDYLAMLRRRAVLILVPAGVALILGFAISFAFAPKYTSQSVVLVEEQKVPENMVQPVVSQDLTARIATLQQQVLSQSKLQPVVEKLYPGKSAADQAAIIDDIRQNLAVQPVTSDFSQIGTSKRKPGGSSPVPGFTISFTAPSAREAQQICNELTSLVLTENQKQISDSATATSDVLNRGIEDAKRNLDDMDSKLATFKKQYVGQLPGDEENNLKILMGLNSQLEANTQTLNRAQQDKSYTESMLAQQLAAWKTSQSSTNPETLQKQLSDLQTQLLDLKARYTDDHPDVIKTKKDIAEVQKKLAEVNKAAAEAPETVTDKATASEPPEIRQLRLQVHQYSDLIANATRDQKHLQGEIAQYQGRVSLSPAIEEQYKQLTRDYESAQKAYQDLLGKKSTVDLTIQMNNESQGERMFPADPASLPDSPSFPNRLLFAAGGLAAGLAIGTVLAMWFEFRDKSIRTEADAETALQLPMLVAVPWVGAAENGNGNGNGNGHKFWNFRKKGDTSKETVAI
jgi:polysaccharide chain length determinant protein (PEP-CTERM system associated)